MSARETVWSRAFEVLIERKLVVGILLLMLLLLGLRAAPFDWAPSWLERDPVPVDAIPDLGENQQIVFTTWEGRSPRDIEDQVTYPLTSALLGLPGVKTVRSTSMLGFSSIYVIFEEDVELYWSRSRILEKLSALPPGTLPAGASASLGPDANGLGQIFWYTLEGRDPQTGEAVGGWALHELRHAQDWTVRYALQGSGGVSEVASIGGHVQEYQIDVDPERLRAYGVSVEDVARAVSGANMDIGARTIEINRAEYVVRGVGLLKGLSDIEQAPVALREGRPLRVSDVAQVALGPADRRGALDVEGAEAVGGIVVSRYGANPTEVIEGLQRTIATLAPGLPRRTLPDGRISQMTIVPFYDRSTLVKETLTTLSDAMVQQLLITVIVVVVLLGRLRSAGLIAMVLPLGVLMSFLAMRWTGVTANVMSLAGIAIAIGTMVDMGIVLVENIVEALQDRADAPLLEGAEPPSMASVIARAAGEVAPAILTSTLTTILSFIPVFALTEAEGKLFTPLAYAKTYALVGALLLALLVTPVAAHWLLRDERRTDSRRFAALWRAAHPAELTLALFAGVAAWFGAWPIALVLLALVVSQVARGVVAESWRPWVWRAESALAALVCGAWLTQAWMPLGAGRTLLANGLLVSGMLALVLGVFGGFVKIYPTLLRWALAHKALTLSGPALLLVFGLASWLGVEGPLSLLPERARLSTPAVAVRHAFPGLGSEFMPAFDEGALLYMPTTMPHASLGEGLAQLRLMDALIKQEVPEVETVVGKLGRAESALDPAPASMYEVLITYKPEWGVDEHGERRRQWRDTIRSPDDIWQAIEAAAALPGVTSAPKLMPIQTRIVMLQSGMRAPMGVKLKGPSLEALEALGVQVEQILKDTPGVRAETVFAERVVGKPYLEIILDREKLARYGVSVVSAQEVLQLAVGSKVLTRTIEGRARTNVRVRYARDYRGSPEALSRVMLPTRDGQQVPLEQVARLEYVRGPQMIKSEDTFLTSYVIFDRTKTLSEVEGVERARDALSRAVARRDLRLEAGTSYSFAGSYESQVRSEARLRLLVPLALALVLLVLYVQFGRLTTALMIGSGVAVAAAGGMTLLWLYGQPWFLDVSIGGVDLRELFQVRTTHLSVAVWVGFIALVGIATDDGVVMATYLKERVFGDEAGLPQDRAEVRARVLEAGMRRVRPCMMTTATTLLALLPVVTSRGRGSDVMIPMALPAIGGMMFELLTLFVVPVLYCAREEARVVWRQRFPNAAAAVMSAPDREAVRDSEHGDEGDA